jgi:predicted alpha/beta hydrolase
MPVRRSGVCLGPNPSEAVSEILVQDTTIPARDGYPLAATVFVTTLDALASFPHYRGALRAIGFDDDPWASPAAIDLLAVGSIGTRPERRQIRDTLWRDAAQWLLTSGTAPASSA